MKLLGVVILTILMAIMKEKQVDIMVVILCHPLYKHNQKVMLLFIKNKKTGLTCLFYLKQPQRLQPQLLQVLQLLQPQPPVKFSFDKVSKSNSKKFVLLLSSVFVAPAKIESNKTSKTLLEKFIISLRFTKFDIIN